MKKLHKRALLGLTFVAITFGLTACSSGTTTSKNSLKLWVTTDSKEFYTKALKDFKADNPSIQLNVIETEDAKAQENVKKDPEKAADVFALPHDQIGQLVDSGVVQAIPEATAAKVQSEVTEAAAQGASYKGKMYAFPYGIESQVLYYDKSKLSEEDVKSYATITSKAKFGGNLGETLDAYKWAPLFMSVGLNLFGPNGDEAAGTNWNNQQGVDVLTWIRSQAENPGFIQAGDNLLSKFRAGQINAFESGPWDKDKAVEAVGKDKLGITPYPTLTIGGQDVQQKSFLGVKLYAVNQAPAGGNKTRIENAYKLAEYLMSAKVQEMQFKDASRNIMPSNKTVMMSDDVQNDPMGKAVITMADASHSVVMPKIPQVTNFWKVTAPVMQDVFNGKIPADQYQIKLDQLMKDLAADTE